MARPSALARRFPHRQVLLDEIVLRHVLHGVANQSSNDRALVSPQYPPLLQVPNEVQLVRLQADAERVG